jgi:S1-C subfamily serine protease
MKQILTALLLSLPFTLQAADLENELASAECVPSIQPGNQGRVFTCSQPAKGSLFQKLGIKKGDVIKSINNQPVDSPAAAMELYSRLKSEQKIQAITERQGKLITLEYPTQTK